jgi:hypothetical protein
MRALAFAAAQLALFSLSGCGDTDPDCGASNTKNLVTRIVKDHKDDRLLKNVISNSHVIIQRQTDAASSEERIKIADKAMEAAVYTLDTIRMSAKDPTTKAVSCVGNLNVQIEGGVAKIELKYEVEKTTDGEPYVSVFRW